MAGGCGWEARNVDRHRRLVLRCHVFQDNSVVGFGSVWVGRGGLVRKVVCLCVVCCVDVCVS